jgi:glycosyltransferase involved in cell wall biosynthesis
MLFHRGTEWGGSVRGSTNILAERFLREGYPVTWLTRPINFFHLFFRRGSYEVQTYRKGFERAPDGALIIAPFTVLPKPRWRWLGEGAWAALAKTAYRTIFPSLKRTLGKAGQEEIEIVWTSGGDGGALRRSFPNAKRIVQCVDLYEAFTGSVQNRLETEDYRDADAVVAIGNALARFLCEHRAVPQEKITVIGQGVDAEAYREKIQEPQELRDLPRPRLIWLGVLEKADPELLRAALSSLPRGAGSLVLIGPGCAWVETLRRQDSRVHFFGPKLHENAVAYLMGCDVGLMLYRREKDNLKYLGQNPLKLYEYAAAGLSIVSTPHEEFLYLRPPVLEVTSPPDVMAAIPEALERRSELKAKALAFAAENTWEKRFQECRALVHRVLGRE